MSQAANAPSEDDMRPEYDLSGGVRGKYYERYRQGTNVVRLDPDVAAAFRTPRRLTRPCGYSWT